MSKIVTDKQKQPKVFKVACQSKAFKVAFELIHNNELFDYIVLEWDDHTYQIEISKNDNGTYNIDTGKLFYLDNGTCNIDTGKLFYLENKFLKKQTIELIPSATRKQLIDYITQYQYKITYLQAEFTNKRKSLFINN